LWIVGHELGGRLHHSTTMGNVCDVDQDAARSKELDKELKKDDKEKRKIIKLLLLGTGESGKSTIVKQMKILEAQEIAARDKKQDPEALVARSDGFSTEDRKQNIHHIRNNAIDGMLSLLGAAATLKNLQTGLEGDQVLKAKKTMEDVAEMGGGGERYTAEVSSAVALLWKQDVIQECVKRKHEFTMLDSAPYFLVQAETIGSEDYLPTDQDIVRARTMTTGIVVVPFQIKNLKMEMVDVGGQRSERKKWIHQFDKVTAVMFIIALSEYDQQLYEDDTTNRMVESENLFREMLNNVFFKKTDFIVFFNKADLFKEKLAKGVSITEAYPNYTGKLEYEEAKNFIIQQFLQHNKATDREVHHFDTTATDTNLVRNVFDSVKQIIMVNILGDIGVK